MVKSDLVKQLSDRPCSVCSKRSDLGCCVWKCVFEDDTVDAFDAFSCLKAAPCEVCKAHKEHGCDFFACNMRVTKAMFVEKKRGEKNHE